MPKIMSKKCLASGEWVRASDSMNSSDYESERITYNCIKNNL